MLQHAALFWKIYFVLYQLPCVCYIVEGWSKSLCWSRSLMILTFGAGRPLPDFHHSCRRIGISLTWTMRVQWQEFQGIRLDTACNEESMRRRPITTKQCVEVQASRVERNLRACYLCEAVLGQHGVFIPESLYSVLMLIGCNAVYYAYGA